MTAPARLGDPSNHGGYIVSGCSTTTTINGKAVAINGAIHSCPIPGHGNTPITATNTKNLVDGQPIVITNIDQAGCGAVITSGSTDTNF